VSSTNQRKRRPGWRLLLFLVLGALGYALWRRRKRGSSAGVIPRWPMTVAQPAAPPPLVPEPNPSGLISQSTETGDESTGASAKPTAKKAPPKKATAEKAPPKKATAEKAPASKAAAQTLEKKAPKKAPAKALPAKKTPAKKTIAKKAPPAKEAPPPPAE
jgi:DNA-binding protein HU-beta